MSILLLPFKIVFLIIAFILKGILYLLAFILNFISEVLVALQYILGSIFVLIAAFVNKKLSHLANKKVSQL